MLINTAIFVMLSLHQSDEVLDYAWRSWRSWPEMQVQDAYKWLFHATLGGEHAVKNEEGPRQWLDREWPSLGAPLKDEPLVVKLTPDGSLIRVNLRPFKQAGGSKERLLHAFIESARAFQGEKAVFKSVWRTLGQRLQIEPFGKLTYRDWEQFNGEMSAKDYPAVHHSKEYEKSYQPAYRVLRKEFWNPPMLTRN